MKDEVEKFWITEEGYPAVLRFNFLGYRVGYVGIPNTISYSEKTM